MAGFMFLGMAYGIYMKASALSWLLCSSLSSWISGWKKRIIHLHYLDLEFLFSVSLYSDRTLLWFRPWFWLSSHWHYYAKSLISRIKKTTRDIISTNVLLKKWSSNKKHRRFANMTLAQQIITIGLCVLGTMTTRSCLFLYFVKTGKLLSSFNMLENFFHPQFSACWSFTVWEM